MTKKIAIDSKGELHNIESEPNICDLVSMKQRISTLYQLAGKLVPVLKKCGFDINDDKFKETFDYLLQPFGVHECIVYFVKTPMSSTSDDVKLAHLLKNDPEKARLVRSDISNGLKTQLSDDTLLSIISTKENGENTKWWLLNAVIIEVERNKFDGKIISINPEKLIPYHKFHEIFNGKIIEVKNKSNEEGTEKAKEENEETGQIKKKTVIKREGNLNKFYVYSPSERDLLDEKAVIDSSIMYQYGTDEVRFEKIREYLNKVLYPMQCKLDKYSNTRSGCLNYIMSNPLKSMFPVYNKIKTELLKIKEVSTVYYKNSRIFFTLGSYGKQCIYVCNEKDEEQYKIGRYVPNENSLFILNGHSYDSIEKLICAVTDYENSKCFEAEPWFKKNESTDIVNYFFPLKKA